MLLKRSWTRRDEGSAPVPWAVESEGLEEEASMHIRSRGLPCSQGRGLPYHPESRAVVIGTHDHTASWEKEAGWGQDGCSQELSLHSDSLRLLGLQPLAQASRSTWREPETGRVPAWPWHSSAGGWLRTGWFQEREGDGLWGSFTTIHVFIA